MGWERSSRGLAINKPYKFISRVPTPSSNFSWHQKIRTINLKKSGVIYKYKCPDINCREQYIGESGRTFGDRYKKHLKAPLPIHLQSTTTGHPINPDCFSIASKEHQGLTRNIKEAMYIRVIDPSLNRDLGRFQFPHVWNQVLQDKVPTLHLN